MDKLKPVAPESQPMSDEQELPLDVRNAIHLCAKNIISTEAACIEWGAEAKRSVELAEESITNLVKMLRFSGSLTTYSVAAPSPAQPAATKMSELNKFLHSKGYTPTFAAPAEETTAQPEMHVFYELIDGLAPIPWECYKVEDVENIKFRAKSAQGAKIDDVIYNHLSSYQGNCDCKYHLAVKNNPQPAIASTEEK